LLVWGRFWCLVYTVSSPTFPAARLPNKAHLQSKTVQVASPPPPPLEGRPPPSNPRALACLVPRDSELASLLRSLIEHSTPPPPSSSLHAAATRGPRQSAEATAGQVDLRVLRVQLKNSLQRLQAGEFSPKVPGSAAHGNAASCAPTLRQDWADKCTAHWATRRRRAIARAALIRWRQQQQDIQVIAELEAELEQAQMELATFRDPARTQVKWHRSRDCFPGHRASIATAASLCLP
jgi:hypothetical protein